MLKKIKALILKGLICNRPPIAEVTSIQSGRSRDRGR